MGGTILLLFNLQTLPQPRLVQPGQAEAEWPLPWDPVRPAVADFIEDAPTWEEP